MIVFLVYHRIQDRNEKDFYTIDPSELLAHLTMAQRSGLPILNPDILSDKRKPPRSGIVFTFDDGTGDHFHLVMPLLMKCDVRALFYVSTAKLNTGKYLRSEQVKSLSDAGHTIGSHSHSHIRLDVLPAARVKEELELSAMAIDNIVGRRPVHFAPPGGFYNRDVQRIAKQTRYVFFRTMDWGYNKVFDSTQIEVVPVAGSLGFYFLKCAFDDRLEGTLKFACKVKNLLRNSLSEARYNKSRALIPRG